MNKLMPWLKSNWMSMTALLVALIAAPVAMYFAAGWRASILKTAESNINSDISALNAIDVTYEIQPYLTGQQGVSVKTTPNAASSNAVAAILEKVNAESEKVRAEALKFNEASLTPLIGGPGASEQLFPNPSNESERLRLLSRMVTEWPRAHVELLRKYHMGMPLPADIIVGELEQVKKQELSRLDSGQPGKTLTPEEQADITRVLSERRLMKYRTEARRVTAYAEPPVFAGVTAWPTTTVLPLETAWEWQHLYWVHEEIIRAIASANSSATGGWRPVFEAPVKRIESIKVSAPGAVASAESSGRGEPMMGGGEDQPAGDDRAELARDFALSHTGRSAWRASPNPIYDIRFVDITLIVASERLPEVLAAFPKTNYMTVVGTSIAEYDPYLDVKEGFDYGAAHLVRAELKIETIWLRGWMKQWMPSSVKKALGIPDPNAVEGATSDGSVPADDTSGGDTGGGGGGGDRD